MVRLILAINYAETEVLLVYCMEPGGHTQCNVTAWNCH
jgi:hypothetical protein